MKQSLLPSLKETNPRCSRGPQTFEKKKEREREERETEREREKEQRKRIKERAGRDKQNERGNRE